MTKSIWVVIPAKNEAASIYDVVKLCRDITEKVVVVDDASSDRTAELAKAAGSKVISLSWSAGAWCAIQTGLRYSLYHGASQVVTLDADGQHHPKDLILLAEAQVNNACDLVIGSDSSRCTKLRRMVWAYIRVLSGVAQIDITSGYKVYSRKALNLLTKPEVTIFDTQDLPVLLTCLKGNLEIAEVEITMQQRKFGESRIFNTNMARLSYFLNVTLIAIANRNFRKKSG